MPKVKVPRKSTTVDMTAMCDVAFLLLTFFMLTSNFVAKEPIVVAIPASVAEIKIPERDIATVLIDKEGKLAISPAPLPSEDFEGYLFKYLKAKRIL